MHEPHHVPNHNDIVKKIYLIFQTQFMRNKYSMEQGDVIISHVQMFVGSGDIKWS